LYLKAGQIMLKNRAILLKAMHIKIIEKARKIYARLGKCCNQFFGEELVLLPR
jgi:hypothetical protein